MGRQKQLAIFNYNVVTITLYIQYEEKDERKSRFGKFGNQLRLLYKQVRLIRHYSKQANVSTTAFKRTSREISKTTDF
jgi:hypothetical protein